MGTEPIMIRSEGAESVWMQPETSAYKDEKHLQEILSANPTQIPGVVEGSIAVREFSTSAGPIDVCVVSPDGTITVVECKLEKNSESRRRVLGQVIDYASSIRADGSEKFRNSWVKRSGCDLDQVLNPDGVTALSFNIEQGRINLCLAVDRIDEDIQRLVEYMNLITAESIMVTALQLAYARLGTVEVLIPSTYGTEIARTKAASYGQSSERWTWDSFLEALADKGDQQFAQELFNRAEGTEALGEYGRLWFGARPKGSIFFHIHKARYAPFYLWINSAGRLILFGTWMQWQSLKNDDRFRDLAEYLGQDVLEGTRGVLVSDLIIDTFWNIASECDLAINDLNEFS
jgi:hypothetical protein